MLGGGRGQFVWQAGPRVETQQSCVSDDSWSPFPLVTDLLTTGPLCPGPWLRLLALCGWALVLMGIGGDTPAVGATCGQVGIT